MKINGLINGPYNITRLEGTINNINKVLYIFSDVHLEPYDQTNCNIDEALDIDQFLSKTFLELDKPIDFFIELEYENISLYKDAIKEMYIRNLRNFFSRNFEIDTNKQVKKSSKYKNVRFHYADFRFTIDYLNNYMSYIIFKFNQFEFLRYSKGQLMYDKFYLNNNIEKIDELNKLTDILKINFYKNYYVNKIVNKIKNNNVKSILHKYLDIFYNNIKNTKKIMKKYYNEIIKINKNYNNINEYNVNLFIKKVITPQILLNDKYTYEYNYIQSILLMDIFFLRRFLDKDYITNAILYCGGLHTIDIMYILVNEFNFKITHTTSNIDNINNKIKNNKYKDVLFNGLQTLINDKKRVQCSDISSFPKNFH